MNHAVFFAREETGHSSKLQEFGTYRYIYYGNAPDESLASFSFRRNLPPPFTAGSLCCEDDEIRGELPIVDFAWHDGIRFAIHNALFFKKIATSANQTSDGCLKC
jgi:hypothetical protein